MALFVFLTAPACGVGSRRCLIFCTSSSLISEFVGVVLPDNLWLSVAQDRHLWKSCEQSFVWSKVLRPRGDPLSVEDGVVSPEDVDLDVFLRSLEDLHLSSE